jgi:hypothetical protein
MPLQLQPGPQAAPDNSIINQRGDNYGSQVVQQFNGKFAEVARRGQCFNFSVAAAAAILLTNTTANGPTIWNPAGSGKILYVNYLDLAWLSGTITVSSLIWNITKNAGSVAATGAPILTFTHLATSITPAMIGSSAVSSMLWAPVTSTYTVAPSFYRPTGINWIAAGASVPLHIDYDGSLAIMPGNALTLNCAVATTTALFWTTINCTEVPLVAGTV